MQELIADINRLHTTEMGALRIKRNLALETDDAAGWCRKAILSADARAERRGKNWYVTAGGCVITVNAGSLTIITAHRI